MELWHHQVIYAFNKLVNNNDANKEMEGDQAELARNKITANFATQMLSNILDGVEQIWEDG